MHIVIAANAFKGSLTSQEAAQRIASGLTKSRLSCTLKLIPIADGGDGTAHLITQKMKGLFIQTMVHDPLGKKIKAGFGWHGKTKTAILEMSDASGIRLLRKEALNPLKSDTRGGGELIRAALDKGAKRLIIGVGGSATVDGGTGLLSELGFRFLNQSGKKITQLPVGLLELYHIDTSKKDVRLDDCEIVVLCDVANKLLGDNGAAFVFGPQKGASQEEMVLLEKCLSQFNKIVKKDLKIDMNSLKHGGAAGGVAAGLAAFANAKLVSGISYFLDLVQFDNEIQNADLVITAEGSLDAQTLEGKGPYGVAKKAKDKNIPVIVLAGQIPLHPAKDLHQYFNAILAIGHAPSSLEEAIKNTGVDLEQTACELGNLLALKLA
ncbi:MAG TPA: glycerate kinase [Hanamia sp.]